MLNRRSLHVGLATLIIITMPFSSSDAQAPEQATKILTDELVSSAVQLTGIPSIGVRNCGTSTEQLIPHSAPFLHQELAKASRSGAAPIVIGSFFDDRVERLPDRLQYWMFKIRTSGGRVQQKDVTPVEGIVDSVIEWVIGEYGKKIFEGVVSGVASAASHVYGIAADEYISAGVRRYNATIEYRRGPGDRPGTGFVQRIVLTCRQ